MFPVDSTEGKPLYLLHFVNRADGSHSFIVNLNVLIKSTIISGYFFTPSQCEKLEEQNCEAFVAVVNSDGELITAGTDMAKKLDAERRSVPATIWPCCIWQRYFHIFHYV